MLSVRTLVNSRLSQKLVKDADAPYYDKSLHFASTKDSTPTEFPTLNVNSLGEPQIANDLEMNCQNAIISTIQLKGYTNTKCGDAYKLIDDAGNVMLGMGYELIYGPETLSDKKPYCVIARFRRTVAKDEEI